MTTSIILARMLEPELFGLIAIYGTVVVSFRSLSHLGFKQALIQNMENDEETYSSVFYVVSAAGLISFLLLVLGVDLYFDYKHTANYWLVFSIYASTILIDSFTIVHETKCVVALDLKFLNFVRIVKLIGGAIGAIILAVLGYRLVALVGQYFIISSISLGMFLFFRPWYPMRVFSIAKVKKLFDFGFFIFARDLFAKVYSSFHSSILGMNYTPALFAQMNRSRIFANITAQYTPGYFNQILFPILSAVSDIAEEFSRRYFFSLKAIASLALLLSGISVIVAPTLIRLVYGSQWDIGAEWSAIISFNVYVVPLASLLNIGLLSAGHSRTSFLISLFFKVFTLLILLSSFYVDMTTLLYLAVLNGVITILIYIIVNSRKLDLSIAEHFSTIRASLVSFGMAYSIIFLMNHLIHPYGSAFLFLMIYSTLFYIQERVFIYGVWTRVMAEFK